MQNNRRINVRPSEAQDVDQLTDLVEQYREFYGQVRSEQTRPYLMERLSRRESVILVAENDDALVGFTQCYPTFSTVSLSAIWLLNDLFVIPDHRRQQVAEQLMQAAEDAAKEAGATRVWLRTAHTNTPAQSLYEKRGWVEDEVFKRYDLML
jgi:ribosomal protein S18 acetylase RimI-like enzyme